MSIEDDQVKPFQMLNQAIARSQKQPGVKGSKTESRPRQADAKPRPPRPLARPGNLAHGNRNRYPLRSEHDDGVEEDETVSLEPNAMDAELDETPRNHVTRQSNTHAIVETSSAPTDSQRRKSSRINSGQRARVSTKEPAPSHSIQLFEVPDTEPKVPHEADGLTNNNHPKVRSGRPQKHKLKPASSKNGVDVGEAADNQDNQYAEDAEEAANIADLQSLPDSRERLPRSANTSEFSGTYPDSNTPHHPQDPDGRIEMDLADLEVFNIMRTTLKRGCRDLKEDISVRPRTVLKAVKTLNNELESITESYITLRASRMRGAAQDKDTNTGRDKSIKNITLKSQKLNLEKESVLASVYLDLMPTFVKAITIGVDAHTVTESISTASINEILRLLASVYNLAFKAVRQPFELQPKARDRKSSIRGPTLAILPMIKGVWQSFSSELRARQKANERANYERIAAEKKKREEKEEALRMWQIEQEAAVKKKREEEVAERKIRLNNLHRHQRQALDAKLADPLFSKWIMRKSARQETKPGTWRKEPSYGTQNSEVTRSAHPLAPLDYEELARNNKRAGEDRKPVNALNQREEGRLARQSNEAKIIFIDTMRSERGTIP